MTSAATSPPDSSPEVLASGGGGALSGIEDAINTVFDPISDAVSAFVFAEITVFGATFPWIVGWRGFLGGDGAALIFGIVLALLVGAVIFGGITSIGRVTSKLVPSMAIIYISACLVVILVNITHVPEAFGAIFSGAFTGEGVAGGAIGALIVGFQRAAFRTRPGSARPRSRTRQSGRSTR